MKKPTKKQWSNITFALVLALIFFTPLGFYVSVYFNKIITHLPFIGPSEIAAEEQVKLDSYYWKLIEGDGKPYNFENEKGNVVVLNFWATWCPPCVAEMPDFQELYNAYGEKVTFMFVAHDEKDKVNKFLTGKGYDLPVYYESSKMPLQFESSSIPTTYILNKSGKIVLEKVGAADWYSENIISLLDDLLKE